MTHEDKGYQHNKHHVIGFTYELPWTTDSSRITVTWLLDSTYKMLPNILLTSFTPLVENLLAIITVNFDVTGRLLITYSTYVKYSGNKWQYRGAVHHLFIDLRQCTIPVGGRSCIILSFCLVSLHL
jgi:hypothetical protein